MDGAPTPGLRGTPVALRSEPGIISARTLRGSEGVNTIRRGGEEGGDRENGAAERAGRR